MNDREILLIFIGWYIGMCTGIFIIIMNVFNKKSKLKGSDIISHETYRRWEDVAFQLKKTNNIIQKIKNESTKINTKHSI